EMLERDGHRVSAVASGQAALEALANEDFDLVMLDFNMHDLDGATVYETYRFGRIDTAPVFFVTADSSQLTANRLQTLGAAGVIYKPVTFDKLRSAFTSQFQEEAGAAPAPAAPSQAARGTPHPRTVPVVYLDPVAVDYLRVARPNPV